MILSRANLRTKVTLLLLALSLGPLLISGIVNENRAVASGKAATRERHSQTARFAAYTVGNLFASLQRDVAMLATRIPVESLDMVALAACLDAEPGLLPEVAGGADLQTFTSMRGGETRAFMALKDGRIFYAQPYYKVRQVPNLNELQWFQRLGPAGGVTLGDLVPFTQPGRPSLIALAPLARKGGPVLGYVGHVVDANVLEEAVWMTRQAIEAAGGSVGPTDMMALITPGGVFAAHSDTTLVGRYAPNYLLDSRVSGTGEVNANGDTLVVARAEVGHTGWFVMQMTPLHVAYRDVYAVIWLLTAVIVLTFLFVMLFADYLATVLLRPIEELERGAQMIGAGALDYRIELNQHGNDELGRLAQTFNQMGENLLKSRRDVEAYSRHLEVANQELDAMVFAITHDLKKSLRGIEAFSTFLEEDYRDKIERDGIDMLKSIVQNVHRIEKLADDLIGLVEHERERGGNSRFSLSELLREARDHCLETQVGEVAIQPNMPELVGDRIRLNLMFNNLISNGLKFNRSPRPRVDLGWSDLGAYWEVLVTDNGIGIEPRYHDHIFDLFFRLNSKDEFDGTGTGLNLCRRIAEEHRGTLTVESDAGKGTRFLVRLPKDPALLTSPGLEP